MRRKEIVNWTVSEFFSKCFGSGGAASVEFFNKSFGPGEEVNMEFDADYFSRCGLDSLEEKVSDYMSRADRLRHTGVPNEHAQTRVDDWPRYTDLESWDTRAVGQFTGVASDTIPDRNRGRAPRLYDAVRTQNGTCRMVHIPPTVRGGNRISGEYLVSTYITRVPDVVVYVDRGWRENHLVDYLNTMHNEPEYRHLLRYNRSEYNRGTLSIYEITESVIEEMKRNRGSFGGDGETILYLTENSIVYRIIRKLEEIIEQNRFSR